MTPCQHCKRFRVIHCRGLCATCYKRSEIRTHYVPAERKYHTSATRDRADHGQIPDVAADELACIAAPKCSRVEKVPPEFRESRVRMGCPWVICAECRARLDEAKGW